MLTKKEQVLRCEGMLTYLASNHLLDNKQSNYTIIRYIVTTCLTGGTEGKKEL